MEAANIASDSDGLTNSPLVSANPTDTQVDEQDKFFDFTQARPHLRRLIDDWHTEIEDTEVRRKTRKVEIDIEGLRQKGDLDEDETIIPVRVIDSNIQREQPPYINYLKNSRRLAIFECLDDPTKDNDLLEQDFTKKCTYTSWETPHYKCLDGSQAHGWDAIEVVYDESKPGNFSLEHIGHDKLLFPRSAIDIQQCPRIIRCYDVSILQLRLWVKKYGFDPIQVEMILAKRRNTQKEGETERIYKLYFKKDGIVNVSWFCMTDGVSDWLKKPVTHYIGIDDTQTRQPKPLDMYPIFILPYRETEEPKVVDHKGRCFLDEFKQEAQTALWSSFVNGMNRASNIYASPSTEDGTGASLKELQNVTLRGGRILSKPMNFWHTEYPDPVVLRTLQYADVANSEETNQVNFAAINREDSRKTAKEIGAAEQQQQLLNSVQLTLFSTFIRQVYSLVWLIVQSQAMQQKIKFLLIQKAQPVINPITGTPVIDQSTGQPATQIIFTNDIDTIKLTYSIRAAGDVDVVQKQEMIQAMQQDMPLVMQTALKDQFILDYFKLKYPDRAERYAAALQQGAQMQQLIGLVQQLSTTLEGVLKDAPQLVQELPDNQRQQLGSMLQEASQLTGAANGKPQQRQ